MAEASSVGGHQTDHPRASLAPKKAVDFLSDKPIEIELEGELLALDGETAPFYVDRPETV